jgi:hypothetical protein
VEVQWDLVIIDEAHHCRRKMEGGSVVTTQLYRTADALKDSAFGMLLLTATPMQLHPFELYSLVELVEPGLYNGPDDFEAEVYSSLALKSAVRTIQGWDEASATMRTDATNVIKSHDIAADLSSPIGREDAIDELLKGIVLTQAIVRNRKRTVGGFTRRRAKTYKVELGPQELKVHDMLGAYLRQGFASARRAQDRLFSLELITLQRLMASSSRALSRALRGRRDGLASEPKGTRSLSDEQDGQLDITGRLALETLPDEIRALDQLILELDRTHDTKAGFVVRLVRGILAQDPNEKVIIFTQFLATQDLLMELLGSDFKAVQFRGSMSRWEKDNAVREFREGAQIMVSTEAGGEGRNFQFCHILINYDLHWNPMRIEQRIGRLDRYGQTKNVHIYNVTARGTIEDRLVDVLERRLNLFEATVGALELMLGEVEEDLNKALFQAAGNVREAADLFERELELRLEDMKEVEEKSADFLIEIGSFRRDVAEQLTSELAEGRVRVDLELLVLRILRLFPTAVVEPDGETWKITPPPALSRSVGRDLELNYHGTFVAGLAVQNESLDFFGFGHPLVDTCLTYSAGEASAGLAAVRSLSQLGHGEMALQLNYLVEFAGVRKWASVHPVAVSLAGVRMESLEASLATSTATVYDGVRPDMEQLDIVREKALGYIRKDIELRRPFVVGVNSKRASDEAARARRIYRYNVRRLNEKRAGLEESIARMEAEASPEQRRILPALRGQIEALRREELALAEELNETLKDLQRLTTVTESIQLINACLLVGEG